MKVVCVRLISSVDGTPVPESRWLTLHAEYVVLSISAEPGGPLHFRILADDRYTPALFDSAMFAVTDGAIPPNWTVETDEGGALELGPARWLASGFWEAFFERDPHAVQVFAEEMGVILASLDQH